MHLKGSLNIPLDELTARAHELRDYCKIYVHCGGGGRAGYPVEK